MTRLREQELRLGVVWLALEPCDELRLGVRVTIELHEDASARQRDAAMSDAQTCRSVELRERPFGLLFLGERCREVVAHGAVVRRERDGALEGSPRGCSLMRAEERRA